MERIESINPERLAWCCYDRGVSLDLMAEELNIATRSLERVMSGEDGLTFNQLRKVADYFGRGVLFFLELGPVEDARVHTAAFRTLTNQKPELSAKLKNFIERVEKQRDIYLSLREDLDEEDQIKFEPPDIPSNRPVDAARIARAWLGLGDVNSFETYRSAIEAKGILVFRTNGYNGKWQIAKDSPILGFTLYDADCPVIVVKKQLKDTQQTFTLAHELGHLLLHKASSIDDDGDMHSHQGHEQEANAFAGNLLVPESFLRLISGPAPGEVSDFDGWLERNRRAWGVSTEVILRRLLDARLLPQTHYTAYREWRQGLPRTESEGTRLYRHREPKHLFGDGFVRVVLDALNARNITLAKASIYLDGLKVNDIHQLEHHYAGV